KPRETLQVLLYSIRVVDDPPEGFFDEAINVRFHNLRRDEAREQLQVVAEKRWLGVRLAAHGEELFAQLEGRFGMKDEDLVQPQRRLGPFRRLIEVGERRLRDVRFGFLVHLGDAREDRKNVDPRLRWKTWSDGDAADDV